VTLPLRRLDIERAIGIALSGWEFYALTTKKVPPLTNLLRLHPALGAAAVGWLAAHLLHEVTKIEEG
jgi:hypothetical protein